MKLSIERCNDFLDITLDKKESYMALWLYNDDSWEYTIYTKDYDTSYRELEEGSGKDLNELNIIIGRFLIND